MLSFHGLFMIATAAIVARGIAGGIEAAVKVLMPILLVPMIGLAAYSVAAGDLAATVRFLLQLDPRHLTGRAALEALGLGFFSIGVGIGTMITYAAYCGAGIDLKEVAVASVIADTAISFLAGFAVFPIVFAYGLDPAGDPGLVFVTLPLAFAQMPFGTVAATTFFVLLFVAALASAISMLEIVVAALMHRFGWRRFGACALAAGTCFVAGIATVLSFNLWSDWHPLAGLEGFSHATVFDLIDHSTSNMLLPLGGLAMAVLAGWVVRDRFLVEELHLTPHGRLALGIALRYIAPAGILAATLAPLWV
jgi:NSS family neurotransmitter:Na+ symporter